MADTVSPQAPSLAPCPICARPATARFKPFCSLRCADADLGQWLTGAYRVPGPPAEEVEFDAGDNRRLGRLDPEDGLG